MAPRALVDGNTAMHKSPSQPQFGAAANLSPSEFHGGIDSSSGHSYDSSGVNLIPSFALLFSVSQLPSFQKDVDAVMTHVGSKNREKLTRIEQILFAYAEKINSEEMPLQL